MVRVFTRSANQQNEMALTICTSISRNCFRLMRDWKLESLANGKEISAEKGPSTPAEKLRTDRNEIKRETRWGRFL